MDFYTVLDEVLELLQRHKRVTYRALKRQFGLDDAYFEDLKAEIIEARQLAVEQDGTMLVWCGDLASPPPPTAALVRVQNRTPLAYTPKHLAEKILTSRSVLEGECKQVTVLFADVAGFTTLAEHSTLRSCTTSSTAVSKALQPRCTASRARSTSTRATGSWRCSVRLWRMKIVHAGRCTPLDEFDGEPEMIAKVEQGMRRMGELEAYIPAIRYLLAVDPGDAAFAALEGTVRRRQLFAALRAFSRPGHHA